MILGYISHNIQTPLNRIKMYLDSFKWTFEKDKDMKKKLDKAANDLRKEHAPSRRKNSRKSEEISGFEMAQSGIDELLELNNDIKVFHDITNDTLQMEKSRTSINSLIQKAISRF